MTKLDTVGRMALAEPLPALTVRSLRNPVVLSNLGIAAVHLATLASLSAHR